MSNKSFSLLLPRYVILRVSYIKINRSELTPHSSLTKSQEPAWPLQSHFTHKWRSWWSEPLIGILTYPQAHFSHDIPVYPSGHSHISTRLSVSPSGDNSPTVNVADWRLTRKIALLRVTIKPKSTREHWTSDNELKIYAPSFDLLRMISRPYHEILQIGEDAYHLRPRHGIAAKLGSSQSGRDVLNITSHVKPALFS